MRITGGRARGRRTVSKRPLARSIRKGRLRPTSSKVREALFDILRERIKGARFVDLYAGTGTVGIEALSRGAERVVFVEQSRLMVDTIQKNVDEFGFREKSMVFKGRARDFLKRVSPDKGQFDIFFLDPPYHSDEIKRILPFIGESELLHGDAVVLVEHSVKRDIPETVGGLKRAKSYRYGDTMLTSYIKNKE
jgi:16S rRNA (guanine966-N2)-methyltransferase